jgi:predicted metal-dependent HD superfamily phosphohydrolase
VSWLHARCVSLLGRLGAVNDPAPLADALLSAWSAPARVYHDRRHLEDCLARLDEVAEPVPERDVIEAALWFHDAIYDPHAADNEERSARWAADALSALGVAPRRSAEVARLVLLTRHLAPPEDEAGRLACDIDLSILGRPGPEYDAYERAIRAEYAWVPAPEYREGRRRILSDLLRRAPLYRTDAFRRRYEDAARNNLRRALAGLDEVT